MPHGLPRGQRRAGAGLVFFLQEPRPAEMQTTTPRPSLLDRAPPLPGLALADLDADERAQGDGTAKHPCGEFSAARFAQLYPERYELIARALLEGFSLDCAARVFHIHERTAAAIREREARSLSAESYRGIQARRARGLVMQASDILAERMRLDPKSITPRDLAAVMREAHNIERSLEGAPSTIAGVIRADGATAALADLLQQAAAAGRGSSDGFGRGKTPPREDPEPAPAVVVDAVAVDLQPLPPKRENATQERTNAVADTAQDTPQAADADTVAAGSRVEEDRATGAGGVPAQQGGPFREDPSAPENFGSANQS